MASKRIQQSDYYGLNAQLQRGGQQKEKGLKSHSSYQDLKSKTQARWISTDGKRDGKQKQDDELKLVANASSLSNIENNQKANKLISIQERGGGVGSAGRQLDERKGGTLSDENRQLQNVTYAKLKIKEYTYVEPEFKVEYKLEIPDALKGRISRTHQDFVQTVLADLEPVKQQPIDEYVGHMSKNLRQGPGQMRMSNGDVYKGAFKNGKRHGTGTCQFSTGALYKGEWREDKPHGTGILFSGSNELIECRFEKGMVAGGRVKMLF